MAKFGRGAVLKVANGTALAGSFTGTFVSFTGLQDVTMETGTPVFVDTTNHATTGLGTSRTVSHVGEGQLTATIQYDGADATHTQAQLDQDAARLKTFRLKDPTATSNRWTFQGYFGGLPKTLPVSGIATANITVSVEPGWVYESDA